MTINLNNRFKFYKKNVEWKGENDGLYKQAAVPVNVFSGNGPVNHIFGKAQPIKKTYRKSLNFANLYSGTKRTVTIKDTMEHPGTSIITPENCVTNNSVNEYVGNTNNKSNTPLTKNQCISDEKHALMRVRRIPKIPVNSQCHSNSNDCKSKKPYFTRNEDRLKYLKKDIKSNLHKNPLKPERTAICKNSILLTELCDNDKVIQKDDCCSTSILKTRRRFN